MASQITLPRLGQGMEEGRILRWLKAEGDAITKGDEIYEVETEKVNIEVEADGDGVLLRIDVQEGEMVPIGTTLAWYGEAGEEIPAASAAAAPVAAAVGAPAPAAAAADSPATTPGAAMPAQTAPIVASQPSTNGRVKASPLARRIASERGVDLGAIAGSGPEGRIIARDLAAVAAAPAALPMGAATSQTATVPTGDGGERIPLSRMRQTIAKRLGEAWQAPAFYLTREIDMENASDMRRRLVAATPDGDVRPTVSDVITRACALALRRHPDINVHFAGDAIVRYTPVHIGMAVATDEGLVVPVQRDVHAKSVAEIARDRAALVAKARSGSLTPADMDGGTFTISNLGMLGIDEFTAVLNPPMAAILAVGATRVIPVAVGRRVEVRQRMTVTLGLDHRAVDGAQGARFLQTLAGLLEDPLTMV